MDQELRSQERAAKARKAWTADSLAALLLAKVRAGTATEFERNQLAETQRIEEKRDALEREREAVLLHTEKKCKQGKHVIESFVTGYKGHVIYNCKLCTHRDEGYDD